MTNVCSWSGVGDRCWYGALTAQEPQGSAVSVFRPDLHHPFQPDAPREDMQDTLQGTLGLHWSIYN